jgi:hypothetical protein
LYQVDQQARKQMKKDVIAVEVSSDEEEDEDGAN